MLNLKTLDDNYKSLINQSIQASIRARKKAGLDLKSPTNIDRLCEAYGITVRFNDINMEGMYEKSSKPRIHISALRPLARRVFTCVHELGHHIFNHGSSIDELQDNLYKYKDRPPEEILAELEKKGIMRSVITQNIDNLHQEAGSKIVYELHGTAQYAVCMKCHNKYKIDKKILSMDPPTCENCNAILKPNFVFFGEALPTYDFQSSIEDAQKCDLFIIY